MNPNVWNAPDWVRSAVFYQIFPDRFYNGNPDNKPATIVPWDSSPTRENFFGGDLPGIRAKLDYLQELGITALYLTPIFKAGTNHRYDTQDYLTIDPLLGTLDDFRELVAALQQRDMRIVLDAVFNHCGDGFPAFQDVVENGADSAYADWFINDCFPVVSDPPSYQTCGGAHFLPKLNTDNPAVRAHLLRVARHWLAQGINGWRLDVPWKVPLAFWREFRSVVQAACSDAYIVGEVWRGSQSWLQGDTVHGVMNYRLRGHILDFCAFDAMDAEDFDYELRQLRDEHKAAAPYHLTLLGSHDTPRILTLCREDVRRAMLCVVFQMTYIGIPMVYYGDEVGMVGENDPLCRGGMLWDPKRQNRELLQLYRRLIHLRRRNPVLVDGAFETLRVFNGVYAYRRFNEETSIIIVLNPREARTSFTVPLAGGERHGRYWQDVLTSTTYQCEADRLIIEHLPAQSAHILMPLQMSQQNGS